MPSKPHLDTPTKARLRGAYEFAEYSDLSCNKLDLFRFFGVSTTAGHRLLKDAERRDLDRCLHHQSNPSDIRGRKHKLDDNDVDKIVDLLEIEGISARRMTWAGLVA